MKLINKNGKHFLVGTAAQVGRVLSKSAKKVQPIDLGWSLSRQADEASVINNERYACADCHYEGPDPTFVGGGCPECSSKNIVTA